MSRPASSSNKSIRVALKSFDDEYTGYLDKYKKDKKLSIGEKVNHLICDLNGDVNWFVKQHQLEYHSVKVTNWLSSNPTHEEIAEFVKKEGELIKAEVSRKALSKDQTSAHIAARAIN